MKLVKKKVSFFRLVESLVDLGGGWRYAGISIVSLGWRSGGVKEYILEKNGK